MTSYVYFVEAVPLACIKVGVSTRPSRRIAKLRQVIPCELRVHAVIPGDRALEAELHAELHAHLVHSLEWFAQEPALACLARLQTEGRLDLCQRCSLPMVGGSCPRLCVDCGVHRLGAQVVRGKAKCPRCRSCAMRLRKPRPRKEAPVCQGCGAALGRQHAQSTGSGLCRSCAMKRLWATPEYQVSIMRARRDEGLARRRPCKRCGQVEPKLGRRAKYHPGCWRKEQQERASSPKGGKNSV